MRIDKFLKLSRLIKRRTIANEACESEKILINGKIAKPSSNVKVGDIISILYSNNEAKFKVIQIKEHVKKDDAQNLYEVL